MSHVIFVPGITILAILLILHTPFVRADSKDAQRGLAASQGIALTNTNESGWMQVAKDVAMILQGLLVPAIAGITIYIAWQQHKTAKSQYRLNLYGKRFAVFEAARSFMQDITAKATTSYERVGTFWLGIAEVEFLFDKDVVDFLEEMRTRGLDLAYKHEMMYPGDGAQGLPVGDERSKVAKSHSDLVRWFLEQRVQLKNRFLVLLPKSW